MEKYNNNLIASDEYVRTDAIEKMLDIVQWGELSGNFEEGESPEGVWAEGFLSREVIEGVFGTLNDLDIEVMVNTLDECLDCLGNVEYLAYAIIGDYAPRASRDIKYYINSEVSGKGISFYLNIEDMGADCDLEAALEAHLLG